MEYKVEVRQGAPVAFAAVTGAPGPTGPRGLTGEAAFNTALIVASENLHAGALVNIWDDAGSFKVRLAAATNQGKEMHGYVRAACNAGLQATVYFDGTNPNMVDLLPGRQYLHPSIPGACTTTPPSFTGQVVQAVGTSVSPTVLNVQLEPPITLG